MGTQVTFYAVKQDGLLEWTTKLVQRAYAKARGVFILCATQEQAKKLDEYLWAFQEDAFIPHGILGPQEADNSPSFPVTLATEAWRPEGSSILIQLAPADYEFGQGFDHVVELVDRQDEAALEVSRDRYRAWKGRAKTMDIEVDYKG